MAARGIVRVVLEASGGPSVRSALRGTVTDARRADRETTASARAAAAERTRLQRQALADSRRMIREGLREEEAARRAAARIAANASREERRNRMAEERRLATDLRRMRREESRGAADRSGIRAAVGGALVGAAGSALGTVRGYASELGVPDRATMIRSFIESQQDFIRTANFAGISDERREEILTDVGGIARRTNVGPAELLDALNRAQDTFATADFAALDFFATNLESIARAAQAGNATVGDMVGALGELQRQLGVSAEEVPDVLAAMVAGMAGGSLTAGDIASNFSRNMNGFTAIRGEGGRGEEGAREFLAMAQALGAGGRGAEGAATLMENLFSALSRSDVRSGIERELGDRDIFDRNGQMTISFGELAERMAGNEAFTTIGGLGEITSDAQARAAILALVRDGGTNISRLTDVSSEEGTRLIDDTVNDLMNSESGRALNLGISTEASFLENGGEVVRLMTEMAGPLAELSAEYPVATLALEGLADMARSAAVAVGGLALINGGLGGGAAGGGAVAATGAAAGGATLGLAGAGAVAAIGGAAMLGDWANRRSSRTGVALGWGDMLDSPELRDFLGIFGLGGERPSGGSSGGGSNRTVELGEASTRRIESAVREGAKSGTRDGATLGAPPASGRGSGEPGRTG